MTSRKIDIEKDKPPKLPPLGDCVVIAVRDR
jgi:hypothetical protein